MPEKKKEPKKTAPQKRRGYGHRRGKVAVSAPLGAVIQVPLTTSFESENLLDLYVKDSAFREAVDTGRYVYVDGKIVLNSSKCVVFRDGKMELHGVTRETEPHYCLHYTITARVGSGIAFKSHCTYSKKRHEHSLGGRRIIAESQKLENAQKISSADDVTLDNILLVVGGGGGGGHGDNFAAAITRLMESNNITEEKLAELTGLHPKTIQRMRNPEEHTSLKSVIAVCVAFHLDMYNSIYLIHLAGYELTNRQEDKVYYFILSIAYKETVYDCNRMLRRLNMSPLTKL
jgi:hypothetical protein